MMVPLSSVLPRSRADLCSHAGFSGLPVDTDGNPCVWLNRYRCTGDCLVLEWEDAWSCQCDDRCPCCAAACSPCSSEWIGPSDAAAIALWESLPDSEGPA